MDGSTQQPDDVAAGKDQSLNRLIALQSLRYSGRVAGLAGGVLLILVSVVAWLGTSATGLDSYWLSWAALPGVLAAFGGPALGGMEPGQRALRIWRAALVMSMTLSSAAWTFATLVAAAALPPSTILLVIAFVAQAFALLPLLSWLPGLVFQLAVSVAMIGTLTYVAAYPSDVVLLPLSVWFSLSFLALIAAVYARRVELSSGDAHYLQFESMELQRRLSAARSQLAESMTQRQTLEMELAEILNLAEDANRAKTEFLATMSHEIRTPLNGILPILEMLRDTRLDEEQLRLVRTAQSSSRHLLRIINDILDFAKVESGKLQLESIEIDVRELVGSVTELMSGSAHNQNLKLSASVADNVPAVVRGDPIRLRQVLINLVSNAIKFTEEGGIRVEVSRGQSSQKEVELLFAVADTGVGMSPETADRLFQSFTQADASTTRKHGGTGLGLVICKRLVELMDGKIGVRSTPGKGSTFWFLVPMRKSVTEVPSARRDLNGVRVLSLITEPELAQRVSGYLRNWGVMEETSSEPNDALSKLRSTAMLGESWAYELVLIDGTGIEQRLPSILAEIRSIETLKRARILVVVRSDKLAQRLKRDYGVIVLTDSLRSEPLRRMLHRLFDVESQPFGATQLQMEEVYDDLNLSAADITLDDVSDAIREGEFSGHALLVEDNPVNLGVLQKALSKLGLTSQSAVDGKQAMSQFERYNFDMIFMDCQMPVMDGYEAARQIRQLEASQGRPPTPIVAMTANAMAGDRERCIDAGMDDYLAKPVGLEQLRGCVKSWLAVGPRASQPHPAALTDPPDNVLDENVLRELRDIMDDEYLGLLQTFLRSAPELIAQTHAAIAQRDVEAMVLPVHSLKSSSANVGAMHLSAMARETERLARGGQFEDAKESFEAVDDAFHRAESALQKHVAQYEG